MAELLNPAPYKTVYDPTCGSAGLLIKARLVFEQRI
jgi:type I restriction enzyme M protein